MGFLQFCGDSFTKVLSQGRETPLFASYMGVATTTDTTDSVRTSFEVFKNLYGMSVQVDETAKSKKDCKAAVWETFGKATPE